MNAVWTSLQPIWKVLVVGLLAGAGLPAIVALGLKLIVGSTPVGESAAAEVPFASKMGGYLCFLVVGLAVAVGLVLIAAPKTFLAKFGLS